MRSDTLAKAVSSANADPEFSYKAAGWTGSIEVVEDDMAAYVPIRDGLLGAPQSSVDPAQPDADNVRWSGDAATWKALLASPPPPAYVDPWAGAGAGGLTFEGGPFGPLRHAALRRFCELMRHAENDTDPTPRIDPGPSRHGQHDAAVGRYVHLDINGVEHRVYYERAGRGIPLLCQHTAGADGRQWRHMLEDERITSKYDVIAYDLPRHGKSLPPASEAWWAHEYKLTAEFAMQVPTNLATALDLDQPVFIGSSIGGMLALDLARYRADSYRAVISVEGALKVEPRSVYSVPAIADVYAQANPGTFAEFMNVMMAPDAPEPSRQETKLHYAQSAPGVFLGDTNYYRYDHDLSNEAHNIDTVACMVFLLTGNYDHLCVEWSERAAREIKGAEYQLMENLGHFPMSEDYERFASYVLPILDKIAAQS